MQILPVGVVININHKTGGCCEEDINRLNKQELILFSTAGFTKKCKWRIRKEKRFRFSAKKVNAPFTIEASHSFRKSPRVST